MISPSNACSQPSSNRRDSSSHARQISSARYSISAASRSRTEECSATSVEIVRDPVLAGAQLVEQRAVDDEVRVAADRRGEVAVRGAGEAGVAEVPRVVASLLERAQHERAERLLPAPRARGVRGHELAGGGCDPGRLGAELIDLGVRSRRRRHVELGEPREQELDRLRLGRLVHAVERLAPPRASSSATHSLARIISSSTSMCACGSRSRARVGDAALAVELEPSSGSATRSAPRANRRSRRKPASRSACAQRSAELRRRRSTAPPGSPRRAVREPLAAADHRAVEDGLALLEAAPNGNSTVTQSRSSFGRSEQRSSASSCGSIGATRPGT